MVKSVLEIQDVTIQPCFQGEYLSFSPFFEKFQNELANRLALSALSTPCPADKQFCVTERQVEWIGRGNQIHTSKRYCSNREYVPTGDNTGTELFCCW